MSESVMRDPRPENIEGRKEEIHTFEHGVEWQVNVSHLLIALAALALLWFLYTHYDGDNSEGEGDETGGVATR